MPCFDLPHHRFDFSMTSPRKATSQVPSTTSKELEKGKKEKAGVVEVGAHQAPKSETGGSDPVQYMLALFVIFLFPACSIIRVYIYIYERRDSQLRLQTREDIKRLGAQLQSSQR